MAEASPLSSAPSEPQAITKAASTGSVDDESTASTLLSEFADEHVNIQETEKCGGATTAKQVSSSTTTTDSSHQAKKKKVYIFSKSSCDILRQASRRKGSKSPARQRGQQHQQERPLGLSQSMHTSCSISARAFPPVSLCIKDGSNPEEDFSESSFDASSLVEDTQEPREDTFVSTAKASMTTDRSNFSKKRFLLSKGSCDLVRQASSIKSSKNILQKHLKQQRPLGLSQSMHGARPIRRSYEDSNTHYDDDEEEEEDFSESSIDTSSLSSRKLIFSTGHCDLSRQASKSSLASSGKLSMYRRQQSGRI